MIYSEIETPGLIIQLWLYDQMLFEKSKKNNTRGYPTLCAPNCLKTLNELKRRGGYRVSKREEDIFFEDPDKYISNKIMDLWCEVGLIRTMGTRDRFYYKILCDHLPPHESLKESIFIEWYFRVRPKDIPTPPDVIETAKHYRKKFALTNTKR